MELEEKYKDNLTSLTAALMNFELSLNADFSIYNEVEIDWIKNAQVQKFEMCIELYWKTAKLFLEYKFGDTINSPKLVIKQLFLNKCISESNYLILINAINDRNMLSHIYKFEILGTIQLNFKTYLNTLFLVLEDIKI